MQMLCPPPPNIRKQWTVAGKCSCIQLMQRSHLRRSTTSLSTGLAGLIARETTSHAYPLCVY
eukprot:4229651-Pyramimonas_sp.AAC.1